jgi:flagellar basal-body rod protein FlgB
MESSTAILALKALDCLSARAEVSAENIANAGTRGYRPLRLDFESALKTAAGQGNDQINAVVPQITRLTAGKPGAELRLDLELATASTTAMRYAALIDVLGRQMQLASLAAGGNG